MRPYLQFQNSSCKYIILILCFRKHKKTSVQSEFKRHGSVLLHKRYQNIQVKKMQEALQSICDDEENEGSDKDSVEDESIYEKSIKKRESNVTTKKSTTTKSRTLNRLCSTTSSDSSDNEAPKKGSSLKNLQKSCKMKVSHKDDSTNDKKLEVQHKTFKTAKHQQQKKIHLENTRNLSSDVLTKKKSKDKTRASSCSSTSDNEQNEPVASIGVRHSVVSHDKKIEKINSDSESECNILFNKSNKKKCNIKQSANEQEKKNVQFPIDIDTNSSSGREFQRTKMVRSNYDSLRKKQNKKIHDTSSKKTLINKQQYKYLKTNITEILDELKKQCSVFESQVQHIENKCKRKPMYMEDTDKIIYKSKSAINKLITEFSSYEKRLINFYKTFVSSSKEGEVEKEKEHESSEDYTTLINKKPHKRKSSDTINKDNSTREIVSDCDSEIFSENETINSETKTIENTICENEIIVSEKDDQCSLSDKSLISKDATDDIAESVQSRIRRSVSPILGKPQGKKNLLKSSDNAVARNSSNDETCIKNDDPQNDLTVKCTDGNIAKCDTSRKESKNKDNKDKISLDNSNELITAIPPNDISAVTNDSLNDIFESSLELDSEVSKSNATTVTNKDTHDLDTNDIQKESCENSNTECNDPKEDLPSSKENELDPLREEEQNSESIFQQETQKLYESNKSSSESDKTLYNESKNSDADLEEQVIEKIIKEVSSGLDSDTSNISDVPFNSTKVRDKSKESLRSITQNKLQGSKGKKRNDNNSDCSTIISPDSDKGAPVMELILDNVKQKDNENLKKNRSSSEETNFLNEENNDKIEECIKNALLESDSNDSISSTLNKEIETNAEIQDIDSPKMESLIFDNDSTKSDELYRSTIGMNNDKSNKKGESQKRNHDIESDSSVGSRVKRRRLQLNKNSYYMNDKKLRMTCYVRIDKLQNHILNQHKNALQKSKEHQNNKKIKRSYLYTYIVFSVMPHVIYLLFYSN